MYQGEPASTSIVAIDTTDARGKAMSLSGFLFMASIMQDASTKTLGEFHTPAKLVLTHIHPLSQPEYAQLLPQTSSSPLDSSGDGHKTFELSIELVLCRELVPCRELVH